MVISSRSLTLEQADAYELHEWYRLAAEDHKNLHGLEEMLKSAEYVNTEEILQSAAKNTLTYLVA